MASKVWDEITYLFRELVDNFTSHFMIDPITYLDAITYLCCDKNHTILVKGDSDVYQLLS